MLQKYSLFHDLYRAPREKDKPLYAVSCPDLGELARNCFFNEQIKSPHLSTASSPVKATEKAPSPMKSVSWKTPIAS